MLFDVRIYRCKPGTIKNQMALYQEHGLEPQSRNLGQPYFYGIVETGAVNTYVHIWQYENAGDREAKRAAMQADPGWQAFLAKSAEAGNLESQENCKSGEPPCFEATGIDLKPRLNHSMVTGSAPGTWLTSVKTDSCTSWTASRTLLTGAVKT